jgi:hypothetical protein
MTAKPPTLAQQADFYLGAILIIIALSVFFGMPIFNFLTSITPR